MIENWVKGVHSRRFDWKPTVRATRGSALKLNSSFELFWLPVRSSLPSILPISFDECKNVRSFVTLWIVYFILIPLVWVVIFKSKKGFLPRNFERSSGKFSTLIHSMQALSNHIAAKFLRKRNSLRGIPAAYLNVLSLIQPLHLLQVQSAPDNSNLQGKSKIVRVIGISSYREFEANKRK